MPQEVVSLHIGSFIKSLGVFFSAAHPEKQELNQTGNSRTLVVYHFLPIQLQATASSFDSNMKDDLKTNVSFALIELFCLRNLMNIYAEMTVAMLLRHLQAFITNA